MALNVIKYSVLGLPCSYQCTTTQAGSFEGNVSYDLSFEIYLASITEINLVDQKMLEAQRIVERIAGCNGLCKDTFNNSPDHDCGCGGR